MKTLTVMLSASLFLIQGVAHAQVSASGSRVAQTVDKARKMVPPCGPGGAAKHADAPASSATSAAVNLPCEDGGLAEDVAGAQGSATGAQVAQPSAAAGLSTGAIRGIAIGVGVVAVAAIAAGASSGGSKGTTGTVK